MEKGYQINDQSAVYFLTFQVINWIDVFTRQRYRDIIVQNLNYCVQNKGLKIYAWVIMSNHMHIICSHENNLSGIVRDFKSYTSKLIIQSIEEYPESRRDWMLYQFSLRGKMNSRNGNYQFWTQQNHAVQSDGGVYDGQLKNGVPDGKGKMIYPDGRVYDGNWLKGKFHGEGTLTFYEGSRYEGEFRNNEMNGYGTFTFADGLSFSGYYKNDKPMGPGIHRYANGDIYIGNLDKIKRSGWGIYIFANNEWATKHIGYYRNDEFDGLGIYMFKNGDYYIGEFAFGVFNGKGIYSQNNKNICGLWSGNELMKEEKLCPQFNELQQPSFCKYISLVFGTDFLKKLNQ